MRKIFCLISACCLLSLSGCGSDVPALETADSRSSESGIEAADTGVSAEPVDSKTAQAVTGAAGSEPDSTVTV